MKRPMIAHIATMMVSLLCVSSAWAVDSALTSLHQPEVLQQGIDGTGQVIAVIDKGVDPNFFDGVLAPGCISIVNLSDVNDNGRPEGWPNALEWHGTLVANISAARTLAPDRRGMAPGARVLSVRFKSSFDIIAALDYVTYRRLIDSRVRVANISVAPSADRFACGCGNEIGFPIAFAGTVARAEANGILVVASTGNSASCSGVSVPACFDSVMKVAAAYDRSYGTVVYEECIDAATPLHRVCCFSDLEQDCPFLVAAPGYDITYFGWWEHQSGTSFAAPFVSGLAALVFQQICWATPAFVRDIIYDSSIEGLAFAACPYSPQPRHIDALRALALAEFYSGPRLPGDTNCDGVVDPRDWENFARWMTGPGKSGKSGKSGQPPIS